MPMASCVQMTMNLEDIYNNYREYSISMYSGIFSTKFPYSSRTSKDGDNIDILADLGYILQCMISFDCPFDILSYINYLTDCSNYNKNISPEIEGKLERVFKYFKNKSDNYILNILLLFPLNSYSYYLGLALLKAVYIRNKSSSLKSLSEFSRLTLDNEMVNKLFSEVDSIEDCLIFANKDINLSELVEQCKDILNTWSKSCGIVPIKYSYNINPEDSYMYYILRREIKFLDWDNPITDNIYYKYCRKLERCRDKLSTFLSYLTDEDCKKDIVSIVNLISSFLLKSSTDQNSSYNEFETSLQNLKVKVCKRIKSKGTYLDRTIHIKGITDIPLYLLKSSSNS